MQGSMKARLYVPLGDKGSETISAGMPGPYHAEPALSLHSESQVCVA